MGGVIVVDAGRSRSTNLGRDAYILIIALDIVIIIRSSINCPTVICLPIVCYFSREKPLVKSTTPRSILHHICFPIYYLPVLFSDLLFQKPKIPCCTFFYFFYFAFIWDLFIQSIIIFLPSTWQFLPPLPVEGLTTPPNRWVGSICYLCVGTVYIVLLGSPTGLIPWFHNWGKYLP